MPSTVKKGSKSSASADMRRKLGNRKPVCRGGVCHFVSPLLPILGNYVGKIHPYLPVILDLFQIFASAHFGDAKKKSKSSSSKSKSKKMPVTMKCVGGNCFDSDSSDGYSDHSTDCSCSECESLSESESDDYSDSYDSSESTGDDSVVEFLDSGAYHKAVARMARGKGCPKKQPIKKKTIMKKKKRLNKLNKATTPEKSASLST